MPTKRSINILITGCAGFIGFHLSNKLLKNKKYKVFGIDNINNYYDVNLKKDRIKILNNKINFKFEKIDITNKKKIDLNFKKNQYKYVINLAAQAGVLYSVKNPDSYLKNNIEGFYNILVSSKKYKIKHLIFASTSSVYGPSNSFPLKETDNTDKPLSFYAATKKRNEVMAHSFSNIYKLACTGLRFFSDGNKWDLCFKRNCGTKNKSTCFHGSNFRKLFSLNIFGNLKNNFFEKFFIICNRCYVLKHNSLFWEIRNHPDCLLEFIF